MIAKSVRPFWLALVTGAADPPGRAALLDLPVPRWLGLLPVRRISLTLLTDFALGWIVLAATLNYLLSEDAKKTLASGVGMLYLTAVFMGLPIVLRQFWPLAAWRILLAGTLWTLVVQIELHSPSSPVYLPGTFIAATLTLYSVAVRCDREIAFGAWTVSVAFLLLTDRHPYSLGFGIACLTVAVLLGYNVRIRRNVTDRLAVEEKRTLAAESAQAVLEERTRIARELHDVVAHHMSVIAIQAEAVPLKAAGDVRQLEEGLAGIRALSLEAIAEMRQVLGVLRDPQGRLETMPQPGLDRVDELVANARAAGVAVVVKRSGSMEEVPVAAALSAYRIVQESLSNVMRHAPDAQVAVELACGAEELRVRVVNGPSTAVRRHGRTAGGRPHDRAPDDGAGRHGAGRHDASGHETGGHEAGGHGLAGMRERATLHGGTLEAGPVEGGGYAVVAVLPLEAR